MIDCVLAEVGVAPSVWDAHRILDTPRRDDLLDSRSGSGRVPGALLHVFTLLSLVLPREPLKIAMYGVLSRDVQMRGTALEYLESVLPSAVRERLWTHLERTPLATDTRAHAGSSALLRSAMQTQVSLRAALDAALKKDDGPSG